MRKPWLISLSLLVLVSCQAQPIFQGQAPVQFQRQSQAPRSGDWFAAMSPELQRYYARAQGKTGEDLFEALSVIITDNYRSLGYGTAKGYIYAVAENAPVEANGKPGLFAAYSNVFVPGTGADGNQYREQGDANKDGTPGDFINCEHTWPQSFFNKAEPQRSDMHHLFPTFSKPNGMRGHLPFGTSKEGQVVYSTANGSKLIARNGALSFSSLPTDLQLSQSEDVDAFGGNAVFEPADTQKGNTARAMLYFYMRWHNSSIRSGDFNAKDFWLSRVGQFTQWAEQIDPPDAREQRRNQFIFEKQGNRNPFIDIPNLASLIGPQTLSQYERN